LGLPLVLVGGEAELDVDEVDSDMSKVDGGANDMDEVDGGIDDMDELDGGMDDIVLLPTLDVLPAGLRAMAIAATSLYVLFGRVVTSMNAHFGTSVPGGIS